ncbi:copper amine oxidase N-terminal domain-containing protein [Paenibacillus sp. IB182496]|uniref:Copper amine oxidase N-terminal domain-containing protein n=1 Tax=Paenibacillus sabuli TaxID=2772509 RepID=A0A927BRS6_9BACL|nr:copper amine oxidase N-terminal domain-containing protein [Paenibacillus sabuli]MBD2845577.1 copper amine oxidase N-terminal domain-containing protein [Paenibacillus sabuli]
MTKLTRALLGLGLGAAIAAILVAGHDGLTGGGRAAAQAQAQVSITVDGYFYDPANTPILEGGRVYLPIRDMSEVLQAHIDWDNTDKQATVTLPGRQLVLTLGSTTALVDGSQATMSETPLLQGNRIYLPLRITSELFDIEVDWTQRSHTVSIAQSAHYAMDERGDAVYWVHRESGDLFVAREAGGSAVKIGTLELDIRRNMSLKVETYSDSLQLVTVSDAYGEPMLHLDYYTGLLVDDRLVKQSNVSYYNRFADNVNRYKDLPVMTDGRMLYLVNAEGDVARSYDLEELAGWDENYYIAGIGEDYLLVRPSQTGLLTYIEPESGETTQLYTLLDEQEQEYALHNDVPYRGDHLRFAGETGGELRFTYDSIFKSGEQELRFPLPVA